MSSASASLSGLLCPSGLLTSSPYPDSSLKELSESSQSTSPAVFFLVGQALCIWHGSEVSLVYDTDCDLELFLVGDFCLCKVANTDIPLPRLVPIIGFMIEVDLLLPLSSEFFLFIAMLVLLVVWLISVVLKMSCSSGLSSHILYTSSSDSCF